MVHAFVACLPQTAQSYTAAAEGGEGSAEEDAADECVGATAAEEDGVPYGGDADDELVLEGGSADAAAKEAGADADASGEGGGGEGVGTAEDATDVDGTVAALDGFPPFFFVIVGCLGVTNQLTISNKG